MEMRDFDGSYIAIYSSRARRGWSHRWAAANPSHLHGMHGVVAAKQGSNTVVRHPLTGLCPARTTQLVGRGRSSMFACPNRRMDLLEG
jgi:hypothetical protein